MAYILLDDIAARHNLKTITQHIGIKKIMLVLKDNAYGHGLEQVARFAVDAGIRHVLVKNNREANKIKGLFQTVLILQEKPENALYSPEFHYTITEISQIKRFPFPVSIQIKIETGMHTGGILPEDLLKTCREINRCGHTLSGVFTQLHSAEDNNHHTHGQHLILQKIKTKITDFVQSGLLDFHPTVHLHNSAGTFRLDTDIDTFDYVRVGAAFYGYVVLPEGYTYPNLHPIMSLWAERLSSQQLAPGCGIGYGHQYVSRQNETVSSYDIGYADGFFRLPKSRKFITSDNKIIRGQISMDYICAKGTAPKICLFNDARITADFFNTIPEDITCSLSPDIPRFWKSSLSHNDAFSIEDFTSEKITSFT